MQAMRAQMQQDAGTAPERMAQRATAMQQRAAGMATMTNAFGALYAVLTPEQKAIADQNVGMMGQPRHAPRSARRLTGFGGREIRPLVPSSHRSHPMPLRMIQVMRRAPSAR